MPKRRQPQKDETQSTPSVAQDDPAATDSPAADSPAADSPAADSPAADSPAADSPVDDTTKDALKTSNTATDEATDEATGHAILPSSSFAPVVGIGASAGGLTAIKEFLAAIPAKTKTGMAFVLVQHLDPDHKSILVDLVQQYTSLSVHVVEDGMSVVPDHVYIIPPNRDLALLHGKLHLFEPMAPRGLRLPIDYFFRSLAQDQQEQAIGIILSGTGTDGTLGIRAIKGAGGLTLAQDLKSAGYDGMPRSAIATGMVDHVLTAAAMPEQLLAYIRLTRQVTVSFPNDLEPPSVNHYNRVLILLRNQTGHDFSRYKRNTIWRRIERRMAINQIEKVENYVSFLQNSPLEIDSLFRDLLIGVTSFFRDPEAFDLLQSQVIPQILAERPVSKPVRVWVAGCSTGEEAYSIAILLQEEIDRLQRALKVQIFATDIDDLAIEKARAAIYPSGIGGDVSPERLTRFFVQEDDNTYRVKKSIREMVVFAEQNLTADPPFSRLDLVSCRNVLIYMGADLQRQVLPIFHYALRPNGWLFLGNSESIGDKLDLFDAVDRKWKLYRRRSVDEQLSTARMDFFKISALSSDSEQSHPAIVPMEDRPINLRQITEQTLLTNFSPTSIVVNQNGDILYIHGRTGRFLEPAAGEASLNILRMVRPGLRVALTTALHHVLTQGEMVVHPSLRVVGDERVYIVNMTVLPITKPIAVKELAIVILQDVTPLEWDQGNDASEGTEIGADLENSSPQEGHRIAELEQALQIKEEYLQTTNEELETANEELKSANEELQSANEELQSTNEELETSKEELQSVNEELMTVNNELSDKIAEISKSNDDMANLMAGTGVGTVFVDNDLRIKRFTPPANQVINLIPSDVGRPIQHLATNLNYKDLVADTQRVLTTLQTQEVSVSTLSGKWYLMRIMPYRTADHVIDGAVITFVNISEQKRIQSHLQSLSERLRDARDLSENIVETVRSPLLVLNTDMQIQSANRAFFNQFDLTADKSLGLRLFDLGDGQWDIPELHTLLDQILAKQQSFQDYRITYSLDGTDVRTLILNAREIHQKADKERLILLGMEVHNA